VEEPGDGVDQGGAKARLGFGVGVGLHRPAPCEGGGGCI
jgi:hypothetical protein